MSSLRLLGSAVLALVTLGAATVSLTPSTAGALQPTSDSPLSPPPNGVRKVEPGSQSARSGWHAFTNATLHVSPTRTIQKATLVVRDGKIVSVGAAGPVPPGAVEHDGSRLHIYAGFIEPYLDTEVPRPEVGTPGTHWNPGVVPQRTALDKGSAGIDAKTGEALRALGFTAAALAPKGGVIRGSSAVVSLAKPSGDPSNSLPQVYRDGAYQAIGFETAGRGSDGTDARPDDFSWSRYPNSQMGAVALIRQTLSDAAWQQAGRMEGWFTEPSNALDALRAPQVAALAEGVPSGPRNINGWNGLMLFDTTNELEALRAAKIAKEFSRPAAILGSGREYARLQAINEDRLPLVLPLNFPRAPEVGTLGAANAAELGDMMHWEQAPTNPRRVMAARSDDSVSLTTSRLGERDGGREAFAGRLSKAIKHGLKPEQALAMLTTNPAKLLGVESIMGTLDVGKVANLVVCDGPLFTEVPDAPKKDEPGYTQPARVVSVWVDGREHVVNPMAEVDIAGRYEVVFTPAPPLPAGSEMKVFFDIDGQPEDVDLKITKETKDEAGKEHTTEIEVKEFTRSGPGLSRFAFSFEHEPFGEKGVFQNSGLVERDAAGLVTMYGDFTRASGKQVSYIARRIGPPSPKKQSLAGAWPLVLDDAGKSGIVLLFDRGNVATLRLPPQLAALGGPDGKGDKPIITDRFKYDGKSLSFEFESAPVGAGTIRVDAAVDFAAAPPRMTGTMAIGNAEPKPKFSAARRDRNVFAGEWRVTQADGQAYPDDGPKSLVITIKGASGGEGPPGGGRGRRGGGGGGSDADRLSLTLRFTNAGKPPLEIAAENVETRIGKLFFEHPLAQLGGEGSSRDELTITFDPSDPSKDTLVGLGRLPDGSTHPYQARRIGADGTEKKETTALKAIPESIGLPVGPYALPDAPAAERMVLTEVTLWTCKDGTSDTVIENGAIAVDGGKITYVGPMAGAPGGEGWKVLSMKGRFVTPGIIDCHSHTGISNGVNESGQAVTAEVRIGDVTNPDDVSWYRQLAGGVTCVNNLHGSANAIGGQSMVNKNRWGAARPDDMHFEGEGMAKPGIKFALGENPKQSNWGERNTTRYPQTRMGVETLIRDRFTAAKEYLALRAAPPAAGSTPPRRDLELEALAEILQGKRLIHCHSYRQDEILMLTRVARDFGFKIGTFQHILEGYKVADEMVKYSGGGSAFSDWWAYKVEVQDAIPYAGPLMHEQGVVVSYNSDSDEMARRMNVEAGKAAKYSRGKDGKSISIPPHEAFKFVTLNPAKQLGAAGRIGTLEVGKDADLAVWSGTPTNPTSRCELTMVDGKVLFTIEADAEHRKRIASERARLIQKVLASGERPARGGEDGGADDADAAASADLRDELTEARSGGRRLLLMDAAIRAADWRREYYLDMLRRGLDPRWQRAGSCGCDELGF